MDIRKFFKKVPSATSGDKEETGKAAPAPAAPPKEPKASAPAAKAASDAPKARAASAEATASDAAPAKRSKYFSDEKETPAAPAGKSTPQKHARGASGATPMEVSPAKPSPAKQAAGKGAVAAAATKAPPAATVPKKVATPSKPKGKHGAAGSSKKGKRRRGDDDEEEEDVDDEEFEAEEEEEEEDEDEDEDFDEEDDDDEEERRKSKKKVAKKKKGDASADASAAASKKKKRASVQIVDDDDDDDDEDVVVPPKKSHKSSGGATAAAAVTTPKKSTPAAAATAATPSAAAAASKGADKASKGDKGPDKGGDKGASKAAPAAGKEAPKEEVPKEAPKAWKPWMQERGPPPNKGTKEIPRGREDCLAGKTFVITGVLDSLEREEAEDLIKRHGGRVTGSVSGKTSFLLAGEGLGESKMKAAKDKGVKVISEDDLLDMIRKCPVPEAKSKPATAATPAPAAATAAKPSASPAVANKVVSPQKPGTAPLAGKLPGAPAAGTPERRKGPVDNELWTTKYRPKVSRDLVGNQTQIAKIRQWLESWDELHLHPADKKGKQPGGAKPSKGRGMEAADFKKALLLYGPPGVGKTSTATILSEELGFEAVEVNASDARGKSSSKVKEGMNGSTTNRVRELVDSHVLNFAAAAPAPAPTTPSGKGKGKAAAAPAPAPARGRKTKMVLIMDEVDGMSGGDRGGISELISTIARAKIPIICICNDKYNPKLKSLLNHVTEMDFRRPTKQQVATRLLEVVKKEGMNANMIALENLVESVQGDIRLCLNLLQMWRARSDSLSYDDVKDNLKGGGKDADVSPFSAADTLLGPQSRNLSLNDRIDLVFHDMDLVPMLVQENYLNYRPFGAQTPLDRLDSIARAAHCISDGDLVNRQIRSGQRWSLAPFAAVVSSVEVGSIVRGAREPLLPGERNFNRFSGWLGKNSTQGKNERLLSDIETHLTVSTHVTANRTSLRLDYLDVFRVALTRPLRDAEDRDEGVRALVGTLEEYSITRDDWQNILDITQFKDKPDPLKDVPAATKAAFTRAYNATDHVIRSSCMLPQIKLGKRKAGGGGRPGMDEGGDGGVPAEEAADIAVPVDDAAGGQALEDEGEGEEGEEGGEMEAIPGVKQRSAKGGGAGAGGSRNAGAAGGKGAGAGGGKKGRAPSKK
eukprot:jgi/Mesvir1/25390/Mv01429-RA.1